MSGDAVDHNPYQAPFSSGDPPRPRRQIAWRRVGVTAVVIATCVFVVNAAIVSTMTPARDDQWREQALAIVNLPALPFACVFHPPITMGDEFRANTEFRWWWILSVLGAMTWGAIAGGIAWFACRTPNPPRSNGV